MCLSIRSSPKKSLEGEQGIIQLSDSITCCFKTRGCVTIFFFINKTAVVVGTISRQKNHDWSHNVHLTAEKLPQLAIHLIYACNKQQR